MRKLMFSLVLIAGATMAQPSPDANSIVVTAFKTVVLAPTDATFSLFVSVDVAVTLDQVVSAVDLSLTAQDIIGIYWNPFGPDPSVPARPRISYVFQQSVSFSRLKETLERLETTRNRLAPGMELVYNTLILGPSRTVVEAARDKALPELIAEAKKRAQALADAAQLKLGAIQAVNETNSYPIGSIGAMPPNITFGVIVRFLAQ